ncbi:UDP-N-acetylglucosamine-peptide N-acetylglucosaminyltransferase, partial [Stenotrophomonas maltophilia]
CDWQDLGHAAAAQVRAAVAGSRGVVEPFALPQPWQRRLCDWQDLGHAAAAQVRAAVAGSRGVVEPFALPQ